MSDVMTAKVETFVLTECLLSPQTDLGAVLDGLRREKTTATLRLEILDGGIRQIVLSKKTKAQNLAKSQT